MRRYFGENAGKIALIVLSILFLLLLFFYSLYGVSAFSGDGEGTSENPFQVTNCEQLQEMRDNLFASYILMNDIDCSDTINWNGGNGFEPIGSNFVTTFSGEFNGNNHKITNLYINMASTSNVGLFGYCKVSKIYNVGLENVTVYGITSVGGLVGISYGSGSEISNSYVKGDIRCSSDRCGVLIGYAGSTIISDSYSEGSVIGEGTKGCVGGLVGIDGIINNSYSTAFVSGIVSSVGGLVGCGGVCTTSYWDVQTSETSYSSCGTGKTSVQMKTQSTFSNWDFINVWAIIDGFSYPYLLWGEPPLLDSDDDGVLDVEDLCPFEDSGGVDADLNGCVDTVAGLQDVIISASVSGEIANQTNASLTSKMDNVVSNVDRENYATAINVLQAFINEVEAQSGKKIDPETAEMLIEYANNLIAELYTEE